jgi:hypothetical protein
MIGTIQYSHDDLCEGCQVLDHDRQVAHVVLVVSSPLYVQTGMS